MRWLIRIALLGVLVVALVVGGVVVYLNEIARSGIERGSTHALGVETTLDSIRLRPISGKLSLSGLRVDNPKGFTRPSFLALRGGSAQIDVSTITEDVIVIPYVELTGLEVSIEQKARSTNYGEVLDNLDKLSSGQPDPDESGPRVVIRELRIKDITAHASLSAMGRSLPEVNVDIPEIKLQNLGEAGGGISMSELAATLTGVVMRAVVRNGELLPRDLARNLDGRLDRLRDGLPLKGAIADFGGAARGVASGAGEQIGRGLDKLRGLFGSKEE